MKLAVLQMTSGIDPDANADVLVAAAAEAAAGGAAMLFTPEMSGLLDGDASRADRHIVAEHEDRVLTRTCEAARDAGIWIHLGSLAVRSEGETRWANRGFVIDDRGVVVARYDKMHLFDVDLASGESWRESSRYVAGEGPVTVDTPVGKLGLSICYDVRFPVLYQAMSGEGATILAVPAAFTVPTGRDHWHVLLRARAVENAAFVVAAAQTGRHQDGRQTYGHSLVIDPWGNVMLDMGDAPGIGFVEIDPSQIDEVRRRIPVLRHRRAIEAVAA